jgi:hypothetical protein
MPYESILIVEDGSCPDGANAYASLSEADAYALPRGLWTATEDEAVMLAREQALLRSSDWLNSLAWKGQPVDADREMAWPRTGIGARGVEIAPDTVPACVRTACIEAACLVASGTDLFAEQEYSGRITARSTKVGPLSESFQYASPGASTQPKRDALTARIAWLLSALPEEGGAGSTVYVVGRA